MCLSKSSGLGTAILNFYFGQVVQYSQWVGWLQFSDFPTMYQKPYYTLSKVEMEQGW